MKGKRGQATFVAAVSFSLTLPARRYQLKHSLAHDERWPVGYGIPLCHIQHEINVYGIKRKDYFALIRLFQDPHSKKGMYVTVNRFHVSTSPTRCLADGHWSRAGHGVKQIPPLAREYPEKKGAK